jgi:hypothetical protein
MKPCTKEVAGIAAEPGTTGLPGFRRGGLVAGAAGRLVRERLEDG